MLIQRDLLTLLVFKFLLKYDKLAHVRMKKSILWMNHRSSGVRSKESQRISRMRRFNGFFFFSASDCSGDNSVDCGCGRVFDSKVAVSLSRAMMVVVIPIRFLQELTQFSSELQVNKYTEQYA